MRNLGLVIKSWVVAVPHPRVLQHVFVQTFGASWLIALATQIKVPLYPIPMTLQDFAIMLIALLTTRRIAVSAVLLYLSYGAIGLPVFASGVGGFSAFTGPTVGYLVGFVLMSGVIASLTQRYPTSGLGARFIFALLGNAALFVPGIGFLTHLFGWEVALKTGLLPFVFVLPIKAALAAYLSVYLRDKYVRKNS